MVEVWRRGLNGRAAPSFSPVVSRLTSPAVLHGTSVEPLECVPLNIGAGIGISDGSGPPVASPVETGKA